MSTDSEAFASTPKDVEPLGEAPPEAVQRAQAERLLQAWRTPAGWR